MRNPLVVVSQKLRVPDPLLLIGFVSYALGQALVASIAAPPGVGSPAWSTYWPLSAVERSLPFVLTTVILAVGMVVTLVFYRRDGQRTDLAQPME